jgi:flavin-dependent dehydrogenase
MVQVLYRAPLECQSAPGLINRGYFYFEAKEEYLRKKETKSVIKTVSLPQWLAIMAEEAGISYSQILQESLKERLGL